MAENPKRALITGITGQDGSYLAEFLLAKDPGNIPHMVAVHKAAGANRLRGGLPADWKIGDKTGYNGKDAAGDIAVAWPKPDTPILITAYVQGGTPTAAQIASVFAQTGRMVAERLA